jgi:hypothetical protein
MSEERYVKQIVSDVMEMAAKIKFLEAKVAASESWNAECVADHDAALRAAKVEALREVKYEALGSRIKCCKSDTLYAEGNDDALNALVKWIDARAAQIEEGE